MSIAETEGVPRPDSSKAAEGADPADAHLFDERVAALRAAYHRTVDHIMTARYGPAWATRGDLPDEAYTTETTFHRWLDDLLDHIDTAATPQTAGAQNRQHPDHGIPFSTQVAV